MKKIVYSMISGNFLTSIPKLDFMYNFAKKREKLRYKGLAEVYAKILEMKLLFEKILKMIEEYGKLSLKKVKKELKLSKKEINFILDLLTLKGFSVEDFVEKDALFLI
ncbi:MAG: hypothetical protein ACP6IP_03225 [Candidatus Njordarchaeia archaeon]